MIGPDERFRAIHEVLINRKTVQGQLFNRVSVLMDNLHLLDDGRLPTLPGSCRSETVSSTHVS